MNPYISYVNSFDSFAELRLQTNIDYEINVCNGELSENDLSTLAGLSARVLINGVYGFSATNDISSESVAYVLESAKKNASFLSKKVHNSNYKHTFANSIKTTVPTLPLCIFDKEFYTAFAMALDSYIDRTYPNLLCHNIYMKCSFIQKKLYISGQNEIASFLPLSFIYCTLTQAAPDGTTIELLKPFGGYGYLEELYKTPEDLYGDIDDLYLELQNKCNGIYISESVCKPCILHPHLAGILTHEAVGHLLEADNVLNSSIRTVNAKIPIASPFVTMVDFAHSALGSPAPIPVYYDDEGTLANDVVLIKDGMLNTYLHSQQTSHLFHTAPSGNARAGLYYDEPMVRMRNTAILPGSSSISDMISSIDDGYYLVESRNGQADLTGEFTFGVTLGYEIKNGKLGHALRDTTISGQSFDVLKSIDMVSDKLEWSYGTCVKTQLLPVGIGGAAIKCKLMLGGRKSGIL